MPNSLDSWLQHRGQLFSLIVRNMRFVHIHHTFKLRHFHPFLLRSSPNSSTPLWQISSTSIQSLNIPKVLSLISLRLLLGLANQSNSWHNFYLFLYAYPIRVLVQLIVVHIHKKKIKIIPYIPYYVSYFKKNNSIVICHKKNKIK